MTFRIMPITHMAKHSRFQLTEGWYRIDSLSKGEYVKRGPYGTTIYRVGSYDRQVGSYDRQAKMYEMDHVNDISRQSLVSGSTRVWAGFTY